MSPARVEGRGGCEEEVACAKAQEQEGVWRVLGVARYLISVITREERGERNSGSVKECGLHSCVGWRLLSRGVRELLTSLGGSEQEMGTGGSPEIAGKACDDPGKSK